MAATNTITGKTLAKLLDLTERRVQQLARDGIIPRVSRGRYELYPAVQEYIRWLRDRSESAAARDTSGTGHETEHEARTRLTTARADIHERTASQMAGDLIPADAVEKAWSQVLAQLRGHLVALPDRAAPQVEDAAGLNEIREILRDAVAEILTEMAETQVNFEEPKTNGSTGTGRSNHDPMAPRPSPRRPRGVAASEAAAPA